jgi:hypothetical protein
MGNTVDPLWQAVNCTVTENKPILDTHYACILEKNVVSMLFVDM